MRFKPLMMLLALVCAVSVAGCKTLIAVPDLFGLTQNEANAALLAAGLVLGQVTSEQSLTVPAGKVAGQYPLAGAGVANGTAVSVVISTGPPAAKAWSYTPSVSSIWGVSIDKTDDGGFIIGGGHYVGYDMYALKLNANGGKVWDKQYSNLTPDSNHSELWRHEARGARQTADGGFILLGSGHNYQDGYPDKSMLLVKTGATGAVEWSKVYAPDNPYDPGHYSGSFAPAALHITMDGGYVALGSCYVGGYDLACILKTDADGNAEYCKVINDNGKAYEELIEGGQQTADGGYVLVGSSANGAPHGYMAVIIKLDSDGNLQWSKTWQYLAKGYGAEAYAITQLQDGGYVMGGLLVNNIAKVSTHGFWMARLNANGDQVWGRDYAEEDIIGYCNALAETPEGDILAVGGSHIGEMTMAKFTAGGSFLWSFNDENLPNATGNSLVLTDDGGCVVVGSAVNGGNTLVMKVSNVYDVD